MATRRDFVISSIAAAATTALPLKAIDAKEKSSNLTSKKRSYGPEVTANKIIQQKFHKLGRKSTYDAFASGEVLVSMRFLFEHMQKSGLNGKIEEHIRAAGAFPVNPSHLDKYFARLERKGTKLSPDIRKRITQHLTENGPEKALAFQKLVEQHGLGAVQRGLYALLIKKAATSRLSIANQVGSRDFESKDVSDETGASKPSNPKLMLASLLAKQKADQRFESISTNDEYGDGDGDGGQILGDGGDGGGDGGDGYGDGGDGYGDGGDGGDGNPNPGDPGDPDTEDPDGTIVYEGMIDVTAKQVCDLLSAVVGLGAGLSAAAIAAWAEVDAEAAAAAAAALGFASVGLLIAALVGVGAIAAYYAVFC